MYLKLDLGEAWERLEKNIGLSYFTQVRKQQKNDWTIAGDVNRGESRFPQVKSSTAEKESVTARSVGSEIKGE